MPTTRPYAAPSWGGRTALALVLAAALAAPQPAAADLIDCSGGSGQENVYQVYVDELAIVHSSLEGDPELAQLMQRLSFKLMTNIREMTLGQTDFPLSFAFCEERRPANQTEFTSGVIENMDDDRVILEVWGQLDTEGGGGDDARPKATINCALIPVLIDRPEAAAGAGFQFVDYSSSDSTSTEIIDLLEKSAELKAFVAIGLGVNFFAEEAYDDAIGYLCRALTILESDLTTDDGPRHEALVAYIEEKTREVMAEALQPGSGYSGGLEFLDLDNPCGR